MSNSSSRSKIIKMDQGMPLYGMPSFEKKKAEPIIEEEPLEPEPEPEPEPVIDYEAIEREAREKAAAIEEEARKKAKSIEEEAYQKGLEEGRQAGDQAAWQKALPLIEELTRTVEEMKALKEKALDGVRPQIVRLSLTVAKKVIHREITTNPDIIAAIVKEAIARMDKIGTITIKIQPELHDMVMKHKAEFLELHPEITLDVTPAAPAGGPLVISSQEEVVVDVDELFNNVVAEMGEDSGEP